MPGKEFRLGGGIFHLARPDFKFLRRQALYRFQPVDLGRIAVDRSCGLIDLILQVLIGSDLLQKGFLERKRLVAGLSIFGNDLVVSVTGSVHSLLLQFLLRREAFQLLLQLLALGDGIAH